MPRKTIPEAELHSHLGSAVDPFILWSIAHRQGIKLPTKEYWEFVDLITMDDSRRNKDLDEMDRIYRLTELIQSSTEAIEESVHQAIGRGYRSWNIHLHEIRFNPMKRNRGGERDLDHIIKSALWGADRATMEYSQVQAGIIIMMDKSLTYEQNEIILNKAIKHQPNGVIAVDIAGPERPDFNIEVYAPLFARARNAGLKLTVHAGEAGSVEELEYVVRHIQPERIGHGIKCAVRDDLVREIADRGIVLEVCPKSNIFNSIVPCIESFRPIFEKFLRFGVQFTICTDGPEMYRTSIQKEQRMLVEAGILSESDIAKCREIAFNATFIRS